jgi:hypothetical protein
LVSFKLGHYISKGAVRVVMLNYTKLARRYQPVNIETIFVLLLVVALLALWAHHNKISDKAVNAAKIHTESQGLQHLDQGVILAKIRFRFTPPLALKVERIFRFEFSSVGDRRYFGWVTMHGMRVKSVELQPFTEGSLH